MIHVNVVSALIIRDRRILLQQRSPSRDYPFQWECPGGKVEPSDESHRHAIARELEEEVGLQKSSIPGLVLVDPDPLYKFHWPVGDIRPDSSYDLEFYRVRPPAGWQPQMLDAVGLGWFVVEEAWSLPMIPGNRRLWEELDHLVHTNPLWAEIWGEP